MNGKARQRFAAPAVQAVLSLVLLSSLALAAAAQSPLISIPGSPFTPTTWGSNSNVVLLSPDGRHLFISNQASDSITVMNVASDGTLSFQGTYTASQSWWNTPTGMATNPAGTVLYTVAGGGWDFTVCAHSIASDGTLTYLAEADAGVGGAFPPDAIAYVSMPTGDFVYVNDDAYSNGVTAFPVTGGGTLGTATTTPTGQSGGNYTYYASHDLVVSGGRLFVVNGTAFNTASNNISVYNIATDGSGALTQVTGSPFAMPPGEYTSGCIAADAAGASLYAGTDSGRIARYAIQSDGSLLLQGTYPIGLFGVYLDGIAVTPDGSALAVTDSWDRIAVVDTASMRPELGSPVTSDAWNPGGAIFNAAGTQLLVADSGYLVQTSVYNYARQPPLPPLAFTLAIVGGAADRFGVATVNGSCMATDPGAYTVNVTIRQRKGLSVVVANGSAAVTTTGIDGKATWNVTLANNTQAFTGGLAEVIVSVGANDPVTGAFVSQTVDQTIKLIPGN